MKIFVAVVLLLGASAHAKSDSKSQVTPVQKVISLMEGMLQKGKKEKHDEQVQFAAYKQFCDDTTVDKKRAIAEATERIEVLKADIQMFSADITTDGKDIAELDEDIAFWKGDEKAATNVREIEKTDYDATHQDYTESVNALQGAIAVLKKQSFDRKQSSDEEDEASLVQVSALQDLKLLPADAKKMIDLWAKSPMLSSLGHPKVSALQDPEGLAVSAPEANAYEFQSSGIVQMLEKLLDKFVDERTTLEKEEMNSRHAYDMLMQDLASQIAQAEEDRDRKAKHKAKCTQCKADAEAELRDTTETLDADTKYLADLTATCDQKASDFESRQELRAEEIEAIEKAIDIISSGAVAGNAEKHLPTMLQKTITAGKKKKTSLAQLRSDLTTQAQGRVTVYLKSRAKELNSRVLSALAAHTSADPFQKVKKMIKDLVVRLMEEANEEAEHKGWCDQELSTNEQTRKEKTEAVETLHAEIDVLESSIAKLTEDITELTKAVAELDAAMAKATKLRQEEKSKNSETISDAEAAQTAVAQAVTVLKEFYAKAGEATALLQQPEIFDKPYKGMQAENGGVLGMLEVIESDFARLESDTKAAEATAQREYDSFMTDSKVDKAQKSTDIKHKTQKKQDESQALTGKKEDLEGTQKELDAALAYFDKLKPSCVDSGVSYEDRVARRKEEIESLHEALKILNGEDIA